MEIRQVQGNLENIRDNVKEVIVGLDNVVELLLISMISEGHILLEGQPGLGKTTLANTFAQSIGGDFSRVQMTPDLLPSDILGVNIYKPYDSTWALRRGPVFANVVLIDELNRASPKVQSAFLQVMQERQVTIENETIKIEAPFMVIGTQLPLGEPGTYPLTSVQIDRFAYRAEMNLPDHDAEYRIINGIDRIESVEVKPVLDAENVLEMVELSRRVYVDEKVTHYIVDLVQTIRSNPLISMGPSPRASIWLYKGARVRALMDGRTYVIPDDVKSLVNNVISHRLILTPEARLEDISVKRLIEETLKELTVPKELELVPFD
jgi:MoxR-like ATPase